MRECNTKEKEFCKEVSTEGRTVINITTFVRREKRTVKEGKRQKIRGRKVDQLPMCEL